MVRTKGLMCVVAMVAAGIVLAWSSGLQADDARLEALERRLVEQEKRIAEQERQIGELKGQVDTDDRAPADRRQIEKILKDIDADAPAIKIGDWAENLDLFGDLRLRYRYQRMGENHKAVYPAGTAYPGRRVNKPWSQGEFRLRVGLKKTWWDGQMEVAVRLDSDAGIGQSRRDDNVPMGGAGVFVPGANVSSDEPILIGLAYAKYKPEAVKGLTIVAGKMENPLTTIKTEMLWDSDLCPEGIAAIYAFQGMEKVTPFVAAGAVQLTGGGGVQLHAYQGGVILGANEDVKVTAMGTWYDWRHVELLGGVVVAPTEPVFGGNTIPQAAHPAELGAQEFDVLDVRAQVEMKLGEIPVAVFGDFARNFEDNDGKDDDAVSVGVKLGQAKKQGDWFVRYRYAIIDENVFPSIVGDAQFMGTDRKGHEIGAGYMISDFLKAEAEVIYNAARSSERVRVAGDTSWIGRSRNLQVLLDLTWSW